MTDTTSEQTCRSDELGGWEALGIPAPEAQAWAQAGYRPSEAVGWRDAGALDPGTAVHWERYGFTAPTAEAWLSIGEIGPADAITMSNAGMRPVQCARLRARDPRCRTEQPDHHTDFHVQGHVQVESTAIGF